MDEISSKTGKVADFPIRMNLQLFASDGTPDMEETAEWQQDMREYESMNAKMDKFMADRAPVEETKEEIPAEVKEEAAKPEVVDPDPKPKQDHETNKAFQEMRKAKEAAEAKAKAADDAIARQWGHMGIVTVEQYEAAVRAEQEAREAERYEAAGLTPDEIEKIRKYDELQKQVEQETQAKTQSQVTDQWNKLYSAYPDLVDSSQAFTSGGKPDWYTQEMADEIARGASPLAAYRNAHFDTIMQRTLGNAREIAKQEALDKLNGKEHLAPNGTPSGDVDHVEIDEETMRQYRALNRGKTDAQIRAWHKKHAGK